MKIAFPPAGVVDLSLGAVNGDLHEIATPGGGQEARHFIGDEGAVAQDVKAHAVLDDAFQDLREIGADEGLATLQGQLENRQAAQFLKKTEPLLLGQVPGSIESAGKVETVQAAQVALAGNGHFQAGGGSHQSHGFPVRPEIQSRPDPCSSDGR